MHIYLASVSFILYNRNLIAHINIKSLILFIRKEGACCPVDSRPLKSENDLFRDLYTSREISQQRTHCPYQQFGCQIELSPVDMEIHIGQCTYKRNLSESQGIFFYTIKYLHYSCLFWMYPYNCCL